MSKTSNYQLKQIDNIALQRLCGVLDQHITSLGKALSLNITRHFDHFTFSGEQINQGINALENLAMVARERDLDDNDIQLAAVEAKTSQSNNNDQSDHKIWTLRTRRGNITGRTPRQSSYIQVLLKHDVVFGLGPAGTGKTYLAVAAAVDAMEKHLVERIVLVRPAVEAGEKLGFLPGDLAQKVDPYLRPLYDALYDLMGFDRVTKLLEKGLIEIAPLAYMRGRTLNGAFIILDEAQNTTPEQMKMFLTRIGFGAKAVITGDTSQIDLPKNIKSGLKDAREKLNNIDGIYFHVFTSEDIVRHPLVQKIVDAYEAAGENKF